jgi:hypothetical protein
VLAGLIAFMGTADGTDPDGMTAGLAADSGLADRAVSAAVGVPFPGRAGTGAAAGELLPVAGLEGGSVAGGLPGAAGSFFLPFSFSTKFLNIGLPPVLGATSFGFVTPGIRGSRFRRPVKMGFSPGAAIRNH